jgi:hypothetical protein
MGRVLTSSANSRTLGERRRCDGASGRRRRGSGEATDGAGARRWSQNGWQSTVSGGGALWSRAQSEREGERLQLRAQVSGGRWASRARGSKEARTCGGGRRSRGRGCVHDGGSWAGGWGRAYRWGWRDRERSGRACERTTPTSLSHGAARERGLAGWRRQAGPACQAPRAHMVGLSGSTWVF